MTASEFEHFLSRSIPEYADEKVKAGNWTTEEALERSRASHGELLPDGLNSPRQHLFTIESDGRVAGRVWLCSDPTIAGGAGFIYDLFVEEAFRRQGVATAAMTLLEREARRLGLRALALHVFGFNVPARSLYQKLGYEITNVNMAKPIGSPGD
jgi:GNAT superfamily N-acetyltransferase